MCLVELNVISHYQVELVINTEGTAMAARVAFRCFIHKPLNPNASYSGVRKGATVPTLHRKS